MELTTRVAPDPILSAVAGRADPNDPVVVALAEAMVAMMRASPGCVGIAAPQVGYPLRLFVLDVTGARRVESCAGLVVLCEPEVLASHGKEVRREGCLSVPDLTGDVIRATSMTVTGLVPGTSERRTLDADAFEARAFQHELDHLDGLLFLDRVAGAHALFPRKKYL